VIIVIKSNLRSRETRKAELPVSIALKILSSDKEMCYLKVTRLMSELKLVENWQSSRDNRERTEHDWVNHSRTLETNLHLSVFLCVVNTCRGSER